jgi:hypothetical protein
MLAKYVTLKLHTAEAQSHILLTPGTKQQLSGQERWRSKFTFNSPNHFAPTSMFK